VGKHVLEVINEDERNWQGKILLSKNITSIAVLVLLFAFLIFLILLVCYKKKDKVDSLLVVTSGVLCFVFHLFFAPASLLHPWSPFHGLFVPLPTVHLNQLLSACGVLLGAFLLHNAVVISDYGFPASTTKCVRTAFLTPCLLTADFFLPVVILALRLKYEGEDGPLIAETVFGIVCPIVLLVVSTTSKKSHQNQLLKTITVKLAAILATLCLLQELLRLVLSQMEANPDSKGEAVYNVTQICISVMLTLFSFFQLAIFCQ